jgi:hypothetical protein
MGYEIEHKGMLVEYHVSDGEPMTRDYPGCPPEVEQESVCVSDWDEFAEWWGAKGERPTFAPSLAALLEKLSEREWDSITDAAFDAAANDEPDFDPPDDYDYDDFG